MAEIGSSFSETAAVLDCISLTGLSAHGYHGVEDFEKKAGQLFSVDVSFWLNTRQAGATDDLTHTINYAEVAAAVHQEVTGPSRDLVETLAQQIAHRLLHDYPLMQQVEVTVHKPEAPIPVPFQDVTVTIRRTRADLNQERPRR